MREFIKFLKGLDEFKVRRNVFLIVMTAIVTIATYQFFKAKPIFLRKVLVMAIAALIIIFVSRFIWQKVAKKCPQCGEPMQEYEIKQVFKGALCTDGKKVFPAIGKRIMKCQSCESEYHELLYFSHNAALHKDYIQARLRYNYVAKNEMPNGVGSVRFKYITKAKFESVKQALINEVQQNNVKCGFREKRVKIKNH